MFKLNRQIGIDLGSSKTRIWCNQDGLIIKQASAIAVHQQSKKVVAVGDEAAEMQGRVNKNIKVYFPIQKGRIYDLELVKAMLKVFLQKHLTKSILFNPEMMIVIPSSLTQAMKKVYIELLYSLGANRAYTLSAPLAAAIGSGVPIADASACFIFQLGAGIVEAAIISLGSVVKAVTSYQAGNILKEKIIYQVFKERKMRISQESAELLKKTVISLDPDYQQEILMTGKSLKQSAPIELLIKTEDMNQMINKYVNQYLVLLKQMLSEIPAELMVDSIEKGLLLSGGLAQLNGLVDYLVEDLGIPVSVVDEAESVVIKGAATVLEHLPEFEQSLGYSFEN